MTFQPDYYTMIAAPRTFWLSYAFVSNWIRDYIIHTLLF